MRLWLTQRKPGKWQARPTPVRRNQGPTRRLPTLPKPRPLPRQLHKGSSPCSRKGRAGHERQQVADTRRMSPLAAWETPPFRWWHWPTSPVAHRLPILADTRRSRSKSSMKPKANTRPTTSSTLSSTTSSMLRTADRSGVLSCRVLSPVSPVSGARASRIKHKGHHARARGSMREFVMLVGKYYILQAHS